MDLSFASARKIAAAIRKGTVSALEATEHAIERIEHHDAALNAVVVRDFDRAREAARKLDRKRGKRGERDALPPLFGVPMTVKESYDVAGLPTTWGSEAFRHNVASADALAVARLKAAGAIVLGKTNVPVMLADWQSFNPVYGTTNNPWDVERSPGGSSGGSAAALAAGFSALESGSDIGASLRDPAHYCGIYAHKPSWGIIPPRGHSLSGATAPTDISVVGPMARTARDLETALGVMAGPEAVDAGLRLHLPKPRAKSLKGLRVAILADHPLCPVDAQIVDGFLRLARALKKEGAKVRIGATPDIDDSRAHEVFLTLLNAALSARLPEEAVDRQRAIANDADPDDRAFDAVMARGMIIEHRLWLRLHDERMKLREAWARFFQDVDVLLCPVGATAAVPHDHSGPMHTRTIEVNGKPLNVADQLFWAGYSCAPLLPATAAPLGFTRDGLPFGMQIVGAPYDDLTTIAVAGMLEKSWLGFRAPPGFA